MPDAFPNQKRLDDQAARQRAFKRKQKASGLTQVYFWVPRNRTREIRALVEAALKD